MIYYFQRLVLKNHTVCCSVLSITARNSPDQPQVSELRAVLGRIYFNLFLSWTRKSVKLRRIKCIYQFFPLRVSYLLYYRACVGSTDSLSPSKRRHIAGRALG